MKRKLLATTYNLDKCYFTFSRKKVGSLLGSHRNNGRTEESWGKTEKKREDQKAARGIWPGPSN